MATLSLLSMICSQTVARLPLLELAGLKSRACGSLLRALRFNSWLERQYLVII
uniref:Uncharacterized protein n=1 Tax=Physcomitrium patens TaxID=3218 RepID=A0A2K1L2I9_PHYPA|nr:hypothetical protein PHYPA_003032 [Physcomitrium patens]